jgi:hypothetical protein
MGIDASTGFFRNLSRRLRLLHQSMSRLAMPRLSRWFDAMSSLEGWFRMTRSTRKLSLVGFAALFSACYTHHTVDDEDLFTELPEEALIDAGLVRDAGSSASACGNNSDALAALTCQLTSSGAVNALAGLQCRNPTDEISKLACQLLGNTSTTGTTNTAGTTAANDPFGDLIAQLLGGGADGGQASPRDGGVFGTLNRDGGIGGFSRDGGFGGLVRDAGPAQGQTGDAGMSADAGESDAGSLLDAAVLVDGAVTPDAPDASGTVDAAAAP